MFFSSGDEAAVVFFIMTIAENCLDPHLIVVLYLLNKSDGGS